MMDRRKFLKGIAAVPVVAVGSKIPEVKATIVQEPTQAVFGLAQTFDSEGDMYGAITGHRSAVIDRHDQMHLDKR